MHHQSFPVLAQTATPWPLPKPITHRSTGEILYRKAVTAKQLRTRSHPAAPHYPQALPAPATATVRVLIVDPYQIVREGLRTLLGEEKTLTVVGEAARGRDALHLVGRLQPDVILIDLLLPDKDGLETIRCLHALLPTAQIVVLTTASDEQSVRAAIGAGATGYLLKDLRKDELIEAMRSAARGEPVLHPEAQRALMRQVTALPFQALTERELDVLRLIAQGRSNRQIADTLCLTEGTVKGYVSIMLAKLQVEDRTQAALYAVKHGLDNG
ncbi:MAG: response regulator transcription factor [Chloroflexota bacterium]|nr:response regulator transcription factor [Chloroflexota bacterium]